MANERYQLYVVDEVEGVQKLVLLGGCKSPQQATELLNTGYSDGKIKNPKQVLLVPNKHVFACKPIQAFQIEALVTPNEPAIRDLTAPGEVRPSQD